MGRSVVQATSGVAARALANAEWGGVAVELPVALVVDARVVAEVVVPMEVILAATREGERAVVKVARKVVFEVAR